MVRAGEMVKLAQQLNERLTSQQKAGKGDTALPGSAAEREEEATLIRTSLVQLGLPAPALTSDMVRSDGEYYEGLARELGALLVGSGSGSEREESRVGLGRGAKGKEREGLMLGREGRGVIGMDEVWGLWMRARGVGEWYRTVDTPPYYYARERLYRGSLPSSVIPFNPLISPTIPLFSHLASHPLSDPAIGTASAVHTDVRTE